MYISSFINYIKIDLKMYQNTSKTNKKHALKIIFNIYITMYMFT